MSDEYDVLIEISAETVKQAADEREKRDAEIERLRAELAAERERNKWSTAEVATAQAYQANQRADKAEAERDALRAQFAEARDVLEPFARWCEDCETYNAKLHDAVRVSGDITMGELRRARAVLEKIKGGEDE